MRLEQPLERLAQRLHHLAVVGLLQIGRREAAREQQSIALGDRQIEVLGEVDEELAARLERPVSTKLRCLVETFASSASSSWLRPRRVRQKRISSPAVCGSRSVWTTTRVKVARRPIRFHYPAGKAAGRYTRGNRRGAIFPGLFSRTTSDQRR